LGHLRSELFNTKTIIQQVCASKSTFITIAVLLGTAIIFAISLGNLEIDQASRHTFVFATLASEINSTTSATSPYLDPGLGTIEYNARYFCGTIVGQDGPLRPGRYNSDINIFNRQQYPVSFLWNAVPSSTLQLNKEANGTSTDSIPFTADTTYRLHSLAPGASISLSCKDFVPSFLLYSNATDDVDRFVEGVSTLRVDLDPSIQAAISSSSTGEVISQPIGEGTNEPSSNILSVDAIYTVNALEVPSREIVLQLIEYTINNQNTLGKLPAELLSKPLSLTVPIRTNETVNPDIQVKDVLAREYALNATEKQSLDITIRNLSLGVGALDDNHAISLQRVNAYQPPPAPVRNSDSP
jgi:hypothetical protein